MKEETIKSLMRECSAYITEKTKEIYTLVPGSGDVNAHIMVIGSGPTAKEEATGIFLDGRPGDKFDNFLKEASIRRKDIYMTYAVKYRPYTINESSGRIVHRDISIEEVELFTRYLNREIEMVRPRLIVTLGEMAYRAVAGSDASVEDRLGKKCSVEIDEMLYEVLPLPHPKERVFNKIATKNETLQVMNGLRGGIDYTITEIAEEAEEEVVAEEVIEKVLEEEALPEVEKALEESSYEMVKPSGKLSGTRRMKGSDSGKKKVIIVYGGSNLADDSTYVVVDRVSSVLTELNVAIKRIDLYKNDYSIDAFLDELEGADGVILATTVEWFGIGGSLQTFLDKCYASRRFEAFAGAYLYGIVVSRQSYERDAYMHIIKSWELLGGVEGVSLVASIENSADLETDQELLLALDKKTEDYYRVIKQKRLVLPTSIHGNKILFKVPVKQQTREDNGRKMARSDGFEEAEKEDFAANPMSSISNYDEFIEKQQKDIEDISSLFKERLTSKSDVTSKSFPEIFEYKYRPDKTFSDCSISWVVNDRSSESFFLEFKGTSLRAKFGRKQEGDVVMTSSFDVLNKITEGKLTVQRAFMTGDIKAKGNFTLLYKLDQLFAF